MRENLLPSLAKPAGFEGRCSQFARARPPFSRLLDMGNVDPQASGAESFENLSGEQCNAAILDCRTIH